MSRSTGQRRPLRKQYHHGDLKNALIRAGAEILATEGAAALTLRRAAGRAGVSHSAPYAHFADKQALVAAISTEGLRILGDRIADAMARHADDPLRRIAEMAWATVRFALEQPDQYRVTFSSVIEEESAYPDYVETAHQSFDALVRAVRSGQEAGAIPPGPANVAAVGLWSLVHGFASLLVNNQLPSRVVSRTSARELLFRSLALHLRAPALASAGLTEEGSARAARRDGKPGRVKPRPAR
jgi:AcrR family transcriptional regulator